MGRHEKRRHRRASLAVVAAATTFATAGALPVFTATAAHAAFGDPIKGSVDTTDVTGAEVNGNLYDTKLDVYLDGGSNAPSSQHLDPGNYFFAVLDPGGQQNPNDGSSALLSDDSAVARSFEAHTDGSVTALTGSTHAFTNGGVQLGLPSDANLGYFDTSNHGGEYIVAVCQFLPDGNGGATAVDPKNCKYDAFKVKASIQQPPPCTDDCPTPIAAPDGSKTATPEHDRKVRWGITKSVTPSSFQQLTAGTATYTVTVTKTLVSEGWSVGGTITVSNPNTVDLPVTIIDDGLVLASDPTQGFQSLCTVTAPNTDSTGNTYADGSAIGTVPAATDELHPGLETFTYTCAIDTDPGTAAYQNKAEIDYTDDQNQPQSVPILSTGSFNFSTITQQGDPESVLVTDSYTGSGSPSDASAHPNGTVVSNTTTWTYSRTFFNSNCQTYPNTATVAAQAGDIVYTDPGNQPDLPGSAGASVTFCGPNNGGLTMGWWQNKNGQALLKANTSKACATVYNYVGTHTAVATTSPASPGDLIQASSKTTGPYDPSKCSTPPTTAKQPAQSPYLPIFTTNVFNAANAAGTGTPMELGQWLTTTLDTAPGYMNAGAGVPTLSKNQLVKNTIVLPGLSPCTTVGSLLQAAVSYFNSTPAYAGNKSVVTAFITEFNNINNNQQQTCQI